LQPNDPMILKCIEKTLLNLNQEKKFDEQIPWLGMYRGVGVGFNHLIYHKQIAHNLRVRKPTSKNYE
jgi:hypothetical protein